MEPEAAAAFAAAPHPAKTYLDQQTDQTFSGVALIEQEGATLVRGAFSRDNALSAESRFWIGSITKSITAAATLALQEKGRLSVDDEIVRFFPDAPADKRAITIHQLLTHSSGLPTAYSADGVVDRDEAVRAILSLPLEFSPGTGAAYSNDAFSLLAAIVEIASGSSYEDHLRRAVFEPAGMTATGFWPGSQATPFAPVARQPSPSTARPNWGFRGATGLFSTVDDLGRFLEAYRSGRIIGQEVAAHAMSPRHPLDENVAIGYGWFIETTPAGRHVLHGGAESGPAHYGWLYWLPDQSVTLVLLSGADERRVERTAQGVLALFAPRKASSE